MTERKKRLPVEYFILLLSLITLGLFELNGARTGWQRYDYYSSLPLTLPFWLLLAGNFLWGFAALVLLVGWLLRRRWALRALPVLFSAYALAEYFTIVFFSQQRFTITAFIVQALLWLLLIGSMIFLTRSSRLTARFRNPADDPGKTSTRLAEDIPHNGDSAHGRPPGHAG